MSPEQSKSFPEVDRRIPHGFQENWKFNENLNFKMSNMNMNIKIEYLKNAKRFPSSYWFDKRKLDNYMLPTFTKKVVKYLEKK